MEAIFDPVYVTEVLNDILSRHGQTIKLIPKENASIEAQACPESSKPNAEQTVYKNCSG